MQEVLRNRRKATGSVQHPLDFRIRHHVDPWEEIDMQSSLGDIQQGKHSNQKQEAEKDHRQRIADGGKGAQPALPRPTPAGPSLLAGEQDEVERSPTGERHGKSEIDRVRTRRARTERPLDGINLFVIEGFSNVGRNTGEEAAKQRIPVDGVHEIAWASMRR